MSDLGIRGVTRLAGPRAAIPRRKIEIARLAKRRGSAVDVPQS
jgi:hypothetical protein